MTKLMLVQPKREPIKKIFKADKRKPTRKAEISLCQKKLLWNSHAGSLFYMQNKSVKVFSKLILQVGKYVGWVTSIFQLKVTSKRKAYWQQGKKTKVISVMCTPAVQKAVDSTYKKHTKPEKLLKYIKTYFKLNKTTESNFVEQLVTQSKNLTKTHQSLVLIKIKSSCIVQEF